MALRRRDFLKQSAAIGAAVGGGAFVAGLGGASGVAAPSPLRPPGALAEDDFTSTCIRCLKCVDACPNRALEALPLSVGDPGSGTPTMHPRKAACMLCAGVDGEHLKCTEVCPSGALKLVRKDEVKEKVHIGTAEIDFDLCYSYNNWSCGACYRACPLAGEAMTIGLWERPTVHPEACVGCGCCERCCIRYPHAIRVREQRA